MSPTTTLIAAGAVVTALGGLMWLRATRDQVWGTSWGNRWGEPDTIWPRWPEPDDGIEGP